MKNRRIDQPEPCFLRMRLVKNGPYVGARIFHRLGMLVAEINGQPADVDRVWTSGEIVGKLVWCELDINRPDNPVEAFDAKTTKPMF